MVREDGQLYTMEGIAAGLIMLLTTYLVLGSTSVYTPGDNHITDMKLEQVGSDIPEEGMNLESFLDDIEKRYLTRALERCDGVKKRAAELLGLTFRSFRYRLAKFGMDSDEQ